LGCRNGQGEALGEAMNQLFSVFVAIFFSVSVWAVEGASISVKEDNLASFGGKLHFQLWTPAKEIETSKTYILIHGTPGSADDWGVIPQGLAEAGHTVYVVDRPGHGQSDANAARENNLFENAMSIYHIIAKREIKKGIVLVGHSYGASVALKLTHALQDLGFGDRVSGLVMSGAFIDDYTDDSMMYGIADTDFGRGLINAANNFGIMKEVLSSYIDKWFVNKDLAEEFRREKLGQWVRNQEQMQTMMVELSRFQDDLDEMKKQRLVRRIPVTLLVGEFEREDVIDQNIKFKMRHKMFVNGGGSRLWMIRDAGHFTHLEKPDEVIKHLLLAY
jgi:pimeloyl-ACP methyl ester carboxylesterase